VSDVFTTTCDHRTDGINRQRFFSFLDESRYAARWSLLRFPIVRDQALVWQMYVDGQAEWRSIAIRLDVFQDFCDGVLSRGSAGAPRYATDLYLCAACAAHHEEAIKALAHKTLTFARSAIARVNHDSDFVRDTLQELTVKLLVGPNAKILEYKGQGPLVAWLRVVATRTAFDRLRKHHVGAPSESMPYTAASDNQSVDARLTKARFGGPFQRALSQTMSELSALERNILRMHVVGRCSIDQIGRAYGVHRATAARWLDRAKTRVFAGVHDEFVGKNSLTESEFRSVAGVLWDELRLGFTEAESQRIAPPTGRGLGGADV
jgi:RNA polymerase sigma-70 factor (ECF subfamily)